MKFGNDKGVNVPAGFANGGTTTVVLDQQGRLVRDFASLGGTNSNCAGGPTPWAAG